MKLYLKYEPDRIGGGWTFANNFVKVMSEHIYPYEEADTYFIPGPTMVERGETEKAKADGKRIVLRLDNAVRDSRNRNTGMSRMKDFSEMADLVIYQSEWARRYLLKFTKKDGPVILNGVDTNLFKPERKQFETYIYSRQNRDETKNWEVARHWFSEHAFFSASALLYIVGNFSPELVNANFDFYLNENYRFLPTMRHQDYAQLLNSTENFIYTYWNDACSNSLLEARASRCKIIDPHNFLQTGGASEIMELKDFSLERMAKEYERELK